MQTDKKEKEIIMKQHDVIISGLHMDLTPAIKNIVYEKVEKLFKHEERIIRLQIELEHSTQNLSNSRTPYLAKGHIEIRRKPIIVSTASEDLYKSIDDLVHKLDRQLRRRSRLRKVRRKEIRQDTPIPVDLPDIIPA
jgi:putative sigma-54 modulation protein